MKRVAFVFALFLIFAFDVVAQEYEQGLSDSDSVIPIKFYQTAEASLGFNTMQGYEPSPVYFSAFYNIVGNRFAAGDTDILVSTTVIEVGINVPNATVMMVENSERFGLAQLHQLRGRVGRGAYQSYCIFVTSKEDDKTMDRLKILNDSNDGFKIASEDLRLRGPGELFGIRQSGEFAFRIADIYTDAELLEETSKLVDELMADDPSLSKNDHLLLRDSIEKYVEKSETLRSI